MTLFKSNLLTLFFNNNNLTNKKIETESYRMKNDLYIWTKNDKGTFCVDTAIDYHLYEEFLEGQEGEILRGISVYQKDLEESGMWENEFYKGIQSEIYLT